MSEMKAILCTLEFRTRERAIDHAEQQGCYPDRTLGTGDGMRIILADGGPTIRLKQIAGGGWAWVADDE